MVAQMANGLKLYCHKHYVQNGYYCQNKLKFWYFRYEY